MGRRRQAIPELVARGFLPPKPRCGSSAWPRAGWSRWRAPPALADGIADRQDAAGAGRHRAASSFMAIVFLTAHAPGCCSTRTSPRRVRFRRPSRLGPYAAPAAPGAGASLYRRRRRHPLPAGRAPAARALVVDRRRRTRAPWLRHETESPVWRRPSAAAPGWRWSSSSRRFTAIHIGARRPPHRGPVRLAV